MELSHLDRHIFSNLSENSRATLSEIARKAGCSIQTVRNRINKMEENLGLRHTIELNFDKLGYTTEFFIKVKFKPGVMPNTSTIKQLVEDCPYVQFAALTEGDFDLFVWAIAPSKQKYEIEMEAYLRGNLNKYIMDWSAHSLLVKRGGFLPISNEIIDMLEVNQKRKLLLKMLNQNSRTTLTTIAEKLNISKPTAKYHLEKLTPYVNRFTSFFAEMGTPIHIIRFFQIGGTDEEMKRYGHKVYDLYLDEPERLFNKTVYATVPDGGIDNFFLETYPSFDEYHEHNEELQKYFGIIIRNHHSAVVTKVLKGVTPVRKLNLKKEIPFLLSVREIKR